MKGLLETLAQLHAIHERVYSRADNTLTRAAGNTQKALEEKDELLAHFEVLLPLYSQDHLDTRLNLFKNLEQAGVPDAKAIYQARLETMRAETDPARLVTFSGN